MSIDSAHLFGRRQIFTDKDIITADNVVEILNESISEHQINAGEIEYLYNYYKGKQPVLNRTKETRESINNKVVENRANEIVSFKVGYLMGEAVQYVNRSGDDSRSEGINTINEFVFAEDKATKDKELADWFTICGTAYRMVLPDATGEEDEAPFEIYTLDPRQTFVVYHSGLGHKPVMGVMCTVLKNRECIYSVYTANEYFCISKGNIIEHSVHSLGAIPIIEYPANTSRLGAFEIVLPLLDSINEVESNRVDAISSFVQAYLIFQGGMTVDDEQLKQIQEKKAFCVPEGCDAKYLTSELNQQQTQTVIDYMYQTVLTICGMPSMGNGKSDSSNNGAVILKNGWQGAEARARDTELMFKKSEKEFLKIALRIASTLRDINVKLSDIEIRFTRRNYENITEKANVLIQLLSSNKIHPRLAFEHSGLFVDPEVAYTMSAEYGEEQQRLLEQTLADDPAETDGNDADNSENR